jgi:hypothetical protein
LISPEFAGRSRNARYSSITAFVGAVSTPLQKNFSIDKARRLIGGLIRSDNWVRQVVSWATATAAGSIIDLAIKLNRRADLSHVKIGYVLRV